MRHFITGVLILSTLLQAVLGVGGGEAVVEKEGEQQQQQQQRVEETGAALEFSSRDRNIVPHSAVASNTARESSIKQQQEGLLVIDKN